MSVLVYTESWNGNFRKSSFETVSYASETAKALGTDVIAVSLESVSDDELYKLGNYGASKVVSIPNINKGDSQSAAKVFSDLASDSSVIVF